MSSLAATRADGYYQPPEFDPQKHKTLNKFHGTHRLGVRAKRINEGILVIRFEMPYKAWCLGCGSLIGKGVRFNADKQCIGHYHSTKIWQFSMTCYWCPQRFVITTDPEKAEYICVEGIRKKHEAYSAQDIDGVHFKSPEELKEIDEDPLLRLEMHAADVCKAQTQLTRMERLKVDQDERFKDDVEVNRSLRRKQREGRVSQQEKDGSKGGVRHQDNKQLLIDKMKKSFNGRRK
eukprot:Blabericola_migrator_1__13178@NODE_904_length_6135_cov_68_019281_g633_i0_p2_GENE_NODE_904_length_6135_cov_68_019281_g633_i0NODE_904_length_6135_cov_68_019281_g633_i0_p2_ORF_typecomplete_len234_score52_70DUF572/PF04502_13/1_2e52_NODE_904_length_6135_cov_68_019281_g633_i035824283